MTSDLNAAVKLISADWVIDGTGRDAIAPAPSPCWASASWLSGTVADLAARFPEAERLRISPAHAILPGMVDSHVHVTFSASAVPFEDVQGDGDVTVGLRGAINARDALLAGVTCCAISAAATAPRSSCATPSPPAPFRARVSWRAAGRSRSRTATATSSAAWRRACTEVTRAVGGAGRGGRGRHQGDGHRRQHDRHVRSAQGAVLAARR